MQSSTPAVLLLPVWPLPISLATTFGISFDFFSSPYLDVSVQAVPLIRLCIQRMMTARYRRRIAPFRDPWIDAYLRLPMAYRSLSRLSSAPSAKAFALRPFSLDHFFYLSSSLDNCSILLPFYRFLYNLPQFAFRCSIFKVHVLLFRSSCCWWAQVDSNHRPHAYQACALTT